MSLSVIVPTLGRPTLQWTLVALEGQLAEGDQLILVADPAGDVEAARGMLAAKPGRVFVETPSVSGWGRGGSQRRIGMAVASGTHLCFIDDDDVHADGALELMREAACDRPVIFRMDHPELGLLWREPALAYGNVGTPMFVVPNKRSLLGAWRPCDGAHGCDFTFIRGCCERMGDPVWREETVARIRPL